MIPTVYSSILYKRYKRPSASKFPVIIRSFLRIIRDLTARTNEAIFFAELETTWAWSNGKLQNGF